MIGVMIGNIAINYALSSSLGPLYNLINTLQIVLHFQGADIVFPANANFFSNLLRTVTQCDVLPPDIV